MMTRFMVPSAKPAWAMRMVSSDAPMCVITSVRTDRRHSTRVTNRCWICVLGGCRSSGIGVSLLFLRPEEVAGPGGPAVLGEVLQELEVERRTPPRELGIDRLHV